MFTFTKIVATLGPVSRKEEKITALIQAGVNVFRLNMSHGDISDHLEAIKIIRRVEKKLQTTVGILCDLQGPKLRIGTFKEDIVTLTAGQKFQLDNNPEPGDETRVHLPFPLEALKVGEKVILNDGAMALQIDKVTADYAETTVLNNGFLSNHKGFNLPNKVLGLHSLTEKDKNDLKAIVDEDIDFIGLSFVQSPEDVKDALDLTEGKVRLIAKIEKPSAVEELDEILELADGIMVARGDLGVECPLEKVPTIQRKIITACRQKGKPVIVATQMLESMTENPLPTRAEISDIATAVSEGTDAVMLSGETAIGKYPVEAVKMMKKTIRATERDSAYASEIALKLTTHLNVSEAICGSLAGVFHRLSSPKALVCFSESGATVLRTARERIPYPILALAGNRKVARFLSLVWGVMPEEARTPEQLQDVDNLAVRLAQEKGLDNGELVITAGFPFEKHGNTNLMHICVCPKKED